MPEVPDLEAIRSFFNARVVGQTIERVDVFIPVVIRVPREEFVRLLSGDSFGEVQRHGKFLLFPLASGRVLVVNPMLTGRFGYVEPAARRQARTCFSLGLENGCEVRYVDQRFMGRVYLVTSGDLEGVPQFAEMGPDVLSAALTEDAFRERLRRHSGQIKGILVNHKFVAGIGNAYADEILWEAGIHPYRKRTQLADDEISALYRATRSVLDLGRSDRRREDERRPRLQRVARSPLRPQTRWRRLSPLRLDDQRDHGRSAHNELLSLLPAVRRLERVYRRLELARQDRL